MIGAMRKDFYLLIDDIRVYDQVEITARTSIEGKLALKTLPITHLLIDHDLGEDISGYDVINWAIKEDLIPPNVFIVSANPVGKSNIAASLRSAGFVYEISGWFKNPKKIK